MKRVCPVCSTSYAPGVAFCVTDGAELVVAGASSDLDFVEEDEDALMVVKRLSDALRRTPAGAKAARIVSSQVAREAELEAAAARAEGPVADLSWTPELEIEEEPEPPPPAPPPAVASTLATPVSPERTVAPRRVPWASLSWVAIFMLLVTSLAFLGLGVFAVGLFRVGTQATAPPAPVALPPSPVVEVRVVAPVLDDELPEEEEEEEVDEVEQLPAVEPAVTKAKPAPAPPPAPEPATPLSVEGSWSGTIDGRPANLTLRVDGARLSGELDLRTGPRSGTAAVTGTILAKQQGWSVNLLADELNYQLIGTMIEGKGSGDLLIKGRNKSQWSLSRGSP